MTRLNSVIPALALLMAIVGSVAAQNGCASGNCISIYECPRLLSLLQSKFLTQSIISQLRQAQCTPSSNVRSNSFVCCTEAPQTPAVVSNIPRPDQNRSPSNGEGNQFSSDCGIEPTTRKIIGGVGVELDEFPWMAILEYEKNDGTWTLECGGFLINKRYVLTAAHCVVGEQVRRVGKLINIRLGEYNTETSQDCVEADGKPECADPVQNFAIEEVISHEDYSPSDKSYYQRENDIALIRLSGNARISDFVSPVCLPSTGFRGTPLGRRYVVAGWGRTLISQKSAIKLKVSVPAFDFNECNSFYQTKNIFLQDSQLCAGGDFRMDSCTGDSGGPLMSQENNKWIAEGIVSFGIGCGLQRPSVYTKVQSFVPWIKANIRP